MTPHGPSPGVKRSNRAIASVLVVVVIVVVVAAAVGGAYVLLHRSKPSGSPGGGGGSGTHSGPPYAVEFEESGLATGSSWTVALGTDVTTNDSPTIGFEVGNGSYDYSIRTACGSIAGQLSVAGAGVNRSFVWCQYGLALSVPDGSSEPQPDTYWEPLDLAVTAGVTTALFALNVSNSTGAPVPVGTPAYNCTAGRVANATNCPATNASGTGQDWYVVLVNATGDIASTFGGSWSGSAIALTAAYSLVFVAYSQYAGTGATLSAFWYGTGETSGTVSL